MGEVVFIHERIKSSRRENAYFASSATEPYCTAALSQLLRYIVRIEREYDGQLITRGELAARELLVSASFRTYRLTVLTDRLRLNFTRKERFILHLDLADPLVTSDLFAGVVLDIVARENQINRKNNCANVVTLFDGRTTSE